MKKAYMKPDIAFENFSLSSNIAAVCAVGTNFGEEQCGYKFTPSMSIFLTDVDACGVEIVDGSDQYNGICYHNPSDVKRLFNA